MAQQTQRSALIQRDITFFLLVGVFLPLTILLFMVPGSWYRAEGYEDLGLLTFVAKDEVTRNKKHYIIYQTNAEGGFRFLEKVPMLYTAKEAVENHQTVQRHVYRAWTRRGPAKPAESVPQPLPFGQRRRPVLHRRVCVPVLPPPGQKNTSSRWKSRSKLIQDQVTGPAVPGPDVDAYMTVVLPTDALPVKVLPALPVEGNERVLLQIQHA